MIPIAQAADPGGVATLASVLEAAGPFALAAVLIVGLVTLWRRLGERDTEIKSLNESHRAEIKEITGQFLTAITEQTRISERSAEALQDVRGGLREVRDAVKACPQKGME